MSQAETEWTFPLACDRCGNVMWTSDAGLRGRMVHDCDACAHRGPATMIEASADLRAAFVEFGRAVLESLPGWLRRLRGRAT